MSLSLCLCLAVLLLCLSLPMEISPRAMNSASYSSVKPFPLTGCVPIDDPQGLLGYWFQFDFTTRATTPGNPDGISALNGWSIEIQGVGVPHSNSTECEVSRLGQFISLGGFFTSTFCCAMSPSISTAMNCWGMASLPTYAGSDQTDVCVIEAQMPCSLC